MSRFSISIDPPQIEDVATEYFSSFKFQGLTLLKDFYEETCYLPKCNIELAPNLEALHDSINQGGVKPVYCGYVFGVPMSLCTGFHENFNGDKEEYDLVGYVTDPQIIDCINDYFQNNLVEFRVETEDTFYYQILNVNKTYTISSLQELFLKSYSSYLFDHTDFDTIKEVFDNNQMTLK